MSYTQDAAETFALRALGWLATNPDLLPVFLGSTGASETDIKTQAADPVFLAAVLDFLMMDDAWVVAFCDQAKLPYDHLLAARAALPGGAEVNWT